MEKIYDMLFNENFSIDVCLQQFHEAEDLEDLRFKLRKYGDELKVQMSDILKNETEAIVILAEALTNLHSRIDRLQEPVLQLREEIKLMYEAIKTAENAFLANLEKFKLKNIYFHSVSFQMNLITSCKYIDKIVDLHQSTFPMQVNLLERIVTRFASEIQQLLELDLLTFEVQDQVTGVQRRILYLLNEQFISCYVQNRRDDVYRCLRMYANMNAHLEAYTTFQKRVIRPALQGIFALQTHSHADYNLCSVYERVTDFLEADIRKLTEIVAKNNNSEFDFVLNSFWTEYDLQSRATFPLIGSPGNPDLFRKRFLDTWELVQKVAEEAGDPTLIKYNEAFLSHLGQFNLPVYFEIIFQQVSTKLETCLSNIKSGNWYCVEPNEIQCKLKTTLILHECIEEALNPNIFLSQIGDNFLKLINLLIARYSNHLCGFAHQDVYSETFCIDVLHDLTIIRGIYCDKDTPFAQTVFRVFPPQFKCLLERLQEMICRRTLDCVKLYQTVLQTHVCEEANEHLKGVTSIPRLYRRTNRNAPVQPSEYVVKAVLPLQRIKQAMNPNNRMSLIFVLEKSVEYVSHRYKKMLNEVLLSVNKTEEALRRFKSRNVNVNEEPSAGLSDEMKIRKQITLDINYFMDTLKPMGGPSGRAVLDKLKPLCINN